jgi:hypothetical protein
LALKNNRTFVRWQIGWAYRSNNMRAEARNALRRRSFVVPDGGGRLFEMTDAKDNKVPPATEQKAPDRELELKVKKHPEDKDAKADLGSDESMDASDPSSATQPGSSSKPAPSSGFPD